MQPSEIEGVKRVVQEKLPEGVNERGLTVTGFLFLHALFIEKGRLETTWTVLRKFGYNNDIRLADELLPSSLFKRAPDQVNCRNRIRTGFIMVFVGVSNNLLLAYRIFIFDIIRNKNVGCLHCWNTVILQLTSTCPLLALFS